MPECKSLVGTLSSRLRCSKMAAQHGRSLGHSRLLSLWQLLLLQLCAASWLPTQCIAVCRKFQEGLCTVESTCWQLCHHCTCVAALPSAAAQRAKLGGSLCNALRCRVAAGKYLMWATAAAATGQCWFTGLLWLVCAAAAASCRARAVVKVAALLLPARTSCCRTVQLPAQQMCFSVCCSLSVGLCAGAMSICRAAAADRQLL